MDILERIREGAYANKLPYPTLRDCGGDAATHALAKKAYREQNNEIEARFKADALAACGLTGHPKAEMAFSYAWEDGHADGFAEVWSYLQRYAELLK